ncbi:hypothetical protein Tco_0160929 [Tanacetum coccineum]
MIAPRSSRYSSNDIVHNHYLEEAKKKTNEHSRIPRKFSDSKHFVCSTCQKCVFNANHDACVSRYLKVMNARTKKPHEVPISATPHKKTVASDTTIQKSKSYYKKLYENTNQE